MTTAGVLLICGLYMVLVFVLGVVVGKAAALGDRRGSRRGLRVVEPAAQVVSLNDYRKDWEGGAA